MFGVLTPGEVGASYGHPLVLLLMGGFILSTAMERSGAHRRIALNMVNLFGGTSSRRLVFGFMAASAVLSMWISNTATTLMLLPVALAVLERSEDKQLAIPLLLGIAYAASVGGIGTPIGTPPNLFFRTIYEQETGIEVGFLTWMSWGVPVVLLFVPIIGLWLTRRLNYRVRSKCLPCKIGRLKRNVYFLSSLSRPSRGLLVHNHLVAGKPGLTFPVLTMPVWR